MQMVMVVLTGNSMVKGTMETRLKADLIEPEQTVLRSMPTLIVVDHR
jgi:hypothetical protein